MKLKGCDGESSSLQIVPVLKNSILPRSLNSGSPHLYQRSTLLKPWKLKVKQNDEETRGGPSCRRCFVVRVLPGRHRLWFGRLPHSQTLKRMSKLARWLTGHRDTFLFPLRKRRAVDFPSIVWLNMQAQVVSFLRVLSHEFDQKMSSCLECAAKLHLK